MGLYSLFACFWVFCTFCMRFCLTLCLSDNCIHNREPPNEETAIHHSKRVGYID